MVTQTRPTIGNLVSRLLDRRVARVARVERRAIRRLELCDVLRGDRFADFRERIFLERIEERLELEIARRDFAHGLDAQRPAKARARLAGVELRERPVPGVRREPEVVEVVGDLSHRRRLPRHDALQPLDLGAQCRGIVAAWSRGRLLRVRRAGRGKE